MGEGVGVEIVVRGLRVWVGEKSIIKSIWELRPIDAKEKVWVIG